MCLVLCTSLLRFSGWGAQVYVLYLQWPINYRGHITILGWQYDLSSPWSASNSSSASTAWSQHNWHWIQDASLLVLSAGSFRLFLVNDRMDWSIHRVMLQVTEFSEIVRLRLTESYLCRLSDVESGSDKLNCCRCKIPDSKIMITDWLVPIGRLVCPSSLFFHGNWFRWRFCLVFIARVPVLVRELLEWVETFNEHPTLIREPASPHHVRSLCGIGRMSHSSCTVLITEVRLFRKSRKVSALLPFP